MKTTLKTILLSSIALPFIAFAQTGTTTTETSSVPVSASSTQGRQSAECIKIATNVRENTITEARKIYNTAVEKAHDERKKALENATTTEAKKAIKDSYASALKKAQDIRVATRENAMAKWKTDALLCKDLRKDSRNQKKEEHDERKSINEDKRDKNSEMRKEKKEEMKDIREEHKSRISEMKDKMKSFFGR